MNTSSAISADNPVRVMVVDDSAVVRGFLTKFIESDSEIKVVSSAFNGQQAVNSLKKTEIDVIVLDIEMPVMDGLTALPLLLEEDPCVQVIVASTLTEKNAEITFKAMNLGANECLAKPTTRDLSGSDDFRLNLIQKVKSLGAVARKERGKNGGSEKRNKAIGIIDTAINRFSTTPERKKEISMRSPQVAFTPEVIAIGSSTGGPQALTRLCQDLVSEKIRQTIFITQHMPPTFTAILASNIAKVSGLECKEAEDGEIVKKGCIYLAKGGEHMLIEKSGINSVIRLSDAPPENYCRPAVDPMIRSLMNCYGSRILAVILTGMGADGKKSCEALADQGGVVLAQDETTSVVWGMPGAVAQAGVCTNVLPLGLLAKEIKKYAG